MSYTIGLDWGGTAHAVCVLDQAGLVRQQFAVAHTAEGLVALRRKLAAFGRPGDLPIALERPSGLIVDALIDAGHPVVPIHPNAVKASRPRYRASGAKNDSGDARLLADLLRTDAHRFAGLNRTGFPGGGLAWVRRPRPVPRPGHSNALPPRREARSR